jgi:PST family polysaccharide transporter
MMKLKERTLRAASIKIFAQGVNFVLRIGSLMVLARILDPKDFGLVAMVTAVTGVFGIFKDAGLAMVTVQRSTITNEEISTLFWLNMLLGLILGALSFAMAPILVMFYREPALFWVTAALATGFIFNAAGVQHSALLQRDMRFGTLSVVETLAQSASTILGIVMALSGYGYWALVAMTVIQPVVSTVMVWSAMTWVPGMPHRGVSVGAMVRFGGTTMLNGLVAYISFNLEKVLLGRFWGAEALGIYGRAFQLLTIPSENLNAATGGVLFAALSRLQDDTDRFKRYFLKSYSLILSLTLPSTIACVLFADDIILLVLGPKWKDVVLIFRLLAPTILVLALINPMYWLLISLGMAGRSLKISLAMAPLVIMAYVLGLPYGPNGVAFAYSTAMMLSVVPWLAWCVHGTMISLRDLLPAVGRPLISAMVAVAVTYIAQSFYGPSMASLPRLILGGAILGLVYLWMILWVMGQKELYLDLLRGLKEGASVTRTTG